MKRKFGVVTGAKIINMISAGLMFVCGLLLMLLPDLETLPAQRLLFGLLFALTGGAKLFGYFSNDLYRLAFQFDLAIGIFCELLSLLIVFMPESAVDHLPSLLAFYVVLDSLLKLQISLDAKRFGMKKWPIMLLSSLLLCAAGAFTYVAEFKEIIRLVSAVGIALMADGLENVFITAYTVRIRARKKKLSEHFGIEE